MRSFGIGILVALVLAVQGAMSCTSECGERGYAEGERFRITILEPEELIVPMPSQTIPSRPECAPTLDASIPSSCTPSNVPLVTADHEQDCYFDGTVFELVAGPWDEGPVCGSGAVGLPPFRNELGFQCEQSRRGQLGMNCQAAGNPCPATLEFFTYPPITAADQLRDDMKLDFAWQSKECKHCSGRLKVRLEALDRAAP